MNAAAVVFAVLTAYPIVAPADVPVPPGLSPGDKYHLVFTTSSKVQITPFHEDAAYDLIQTAAHNAGMGSDEGVSWKRIMTVRNPRLYPPVFPARMVAKVEADTPVYNMHMELVATGFDDFWDGSLLEDLGWDEFGSRIQASQGVEVRTYSDPKGFWATDMAGSAIRKDGGWIAAAARPGAAALRVYALSEELTVGGDPHDYPPPNPDQSRIAINAGLGDAWYDPQTPGQGFFITVLPELESIFLAWFTFDTERPPENTSTHIGDPGHRWLTAVGNYYPDGGAVLDVELTSGGIFGAAQPAPIQTPSYGGISLEFQSCNELELAYDLPSTVGFGIHNLQRISDDKVALCEELLASAEAPATQAQGTDSNVVALNAGHSDAWFDRQTPGQGFFITVLPGDEKIFLAWFTFDTERPPGDITAAMGDPGHRWLTASGSFSGTSAELEVELTSGGVFDSVEPAVTQTSYGTINLEFTGCDELELAYELPSVARSGVVQLERVSAENLALCEALSSP